MELKVSADFDILKASFAFLIAILNQLSSDRQPNLIYFKKDCFDLGLKSNFGTESCSNWFRVVFINIFYFVIKTFLSLRFQCIFKAIKFSYNLAQNIWSHFEWFLDTTNKLEPDHYHQKVIVQAATWVGKPLKTYNLRKFLKRLDVNFENFDSCAKKLQTIRSKIFHRKTCFINFRNMSTRVYQHVYRIEGIFAYFFQCKIYYPRYSN